MLRKLTGLIGYTFPSEVVGGTTEKRLDKTMSCSYNVCVIHADYILNLPHATFGWH